MRYVKNSLAVFLLSILTAGTIFFVIQYGGIDVAAASGYGTPSTTSTTSSAASSGSGTLTCPATGCTASTCHATNGSGVPGGHGQGSRR